VLNKILGFSALGFSLTFIIASSKKEKETLMGPEQTN
jgi:hypothetical protein